MKEASDLLINKTNELIKKYQKEDLIVFFNINILYFFMRFGEQKN